MTTFALVHGAWHGAWCWEMLSPLLRQAGHDVVAMDLPCDDTTATFENYADVVCIALDDCDEDVVLVGHSMGGGTVPLVAARRPVRHVVYLCAYVPAAGRTLNEEADEPRVERALSIRIGRTTWADLGPAERVLRRLRGRDRRCCIASSSTAGEIPSIQLFSLAELPAVSSTYVVCSEDQIIRPDWSRRAARGRLGVNAIEFPGSHSPMLSRPQAVADVLLGLV